MSRIIIQTKVRLKRPFLCFLFIVNGLWLQGQQYRYDYTWLMSDYTSNLMVMKFHKPVDSNNIRIDSVKKEIRFRFTNSMISNSAGELVAYSNGCFINHREYDVMENGGDINPGNVRMESCTTAYNYYPTAEQSMVFIPDPMDIMKYYLIHNSAVLQENPLKVWTDALRYSVIDMRYNNGLGKTILKNVPLINDSTTLADIAVVKHSNNKDWWIVVKKFIRGSYDKFLLSNGNFQIVNQQEIGDTTNHYQDGGGGTLTFSPDGSRLIRYHPYDDGFFLFDFDRTTGQLSNYQRILVTDSLVLDGGACFSPSGRFLYVGTYWDLYQYDLESTDIKGSEVHIAHYDGYKTKGILRAMIGRMQWGPDCKIYVNCRNSMDALHVIHRPNEKGIACDFRPHDLKLPQLHGGTLPYFPNYRLGLAPICDPELTVSVSEVPVLPEVYVFPNPARDRIHISVREVSSNAGRLQIYNTAGQRIKESAMVSGMNENKIEVSGWQSGIYFYVIYLNDGRMMNGKFVVE